MSAPDPNYLAEYRDVEQLCYLGLRAAFGAERSRRSLRAQARSCARRKFQCIGDWAVRRTLPPPRVEGWGHLLRAREGGRGVVLCTPHVGPSYWIPLELMARGLPVTMLIDAPNYERLRQEYSYWRGRYAGDLDDPVRFINAEEPTASWQMVRALREARVVFVWLDGNSGLEQAETAKTLVEVNFCGLKIRVRKGPAFLSAYTDAPLVPVVARDGRNGRHALRFEPGLSKAVGESREDFCARATQHLFDVLESYVRRDPACWEEWYHVHRWEVRDRPADGATPPLGADCSPAQVLSLVLGVNAGLIDFLELSEGPVLVNVRTGVSLLLTPPVADLLRAFDGRRTVAQVLERLAPKHGEGAVLQVLLELSRHGSVIPLGMANDREAVPAEATPDNSSPRAARGGSGRRGGRTSPRKRAVATPGTEI